MPISVRTFSAADHAAKFDRADITAESLLAGLNDADRQKIAKVEADLDAVVETIDRFKTAQGYTPEREALHEDIFARLFTEKAVAAATPALGEKPIFHVLGGRGGSGKSALAGPAYDPARVIVIDPDAIKAQLPEYAGWNAFEVHEESSEIAKMALEACREASLNVVLDATLKNKKHARDQIAQFQRADYRIQLHYMFLPRHLAAERALARFLGPTGRYVPVSIILENTENERNFDALKPRAEAWSFRDNQVAAGLAPALIAEWP